MWNCRLAKGGYGFKCAGHMILDSFGLSHQGIYAVEMVGRLYVFRRDVFRSAMLFDFLIAGDSDSSGQ